MISAEEIPEALAEWIKENAAGNGTDLAAVNTAIIIYQGFDDEGDNFWNYVVMSEDSVMHIVGLVEVSKTRMMAYQIAGAVGEVQREVEEEDETDT